MASKTKFLFFTILTIQITLLLVYVAIRDHNAGSSISGHISHVRSDTSRSNFTDPGSTLITAVTSFFSEVTTRSSGENVTKLKSSTESVKVTTPVEDIYRHSSAKDAGSNPGGKLGKQKQSSVNTVTEGPSINDASKHGVFQQIDGMEAWIYSAFFDHVSAQQGRPMVRMFGVVYSTCFLQTKCTFFMSDNSSLTVTGYITAFPDAHGMKYFPSYVECFLPSNVRPTHVSVSFNTKDTLSPQTTVSVSPQMNVSVSPQKNVSVIPQTNVCPSLQTKENSTNRLQIIYPGPRIRNFTVCYSVLHSSYSMVSQLIQSIEMNRLHGADHFMVYNYSISPQVDQILRRYQEDGLVTVLQWSIPTQQSWYFGQTAAINDCFYRNRNTSRFVVVMDTDELIIPRNHFTWMEILDIASPQEADVSMFMNSSNPAKKGNTLTPCFMVLSSYFSIDSTPKWESLPPQFPFTEEEKKNIAKYKILTLSQYMRTEKIFPPRNRSKYIARPECVYNAGIHVVHKFIYFMRCLYVKDSLALLHHYRKPNLKSGIVLDTSILKFKQKLYPRIMEKILTVS